MAAATIADGNHRDSLGNRLGVHAKLTAPANSTTWETGLSLIQNVQVTFADTNTVAADSYAATVSGGTVTFTLAGTARDIWVLAIGR